MAEPARVLFVCWGNICRSPTAEGILRALVADAGLDAAVVVDSAGTSREHEGEPPDRRAIAEATRRGLDISDLRARQVSAADLDAFDLVLVADGVVEARVRRLVRDRPHAAGAVRTMASFGPDPLAVPEVPDPWYGGQDGFVAVYDLLESICAGVLDHLRDEHPALRTSARRA